MRSFIVIVTLILLPLTFPWACDLKAEDYSGQITFKDSSETSYDWFWVLPEKDKLRYSKDMMDLREPRQQLSFVRLPSVWRIDFLDFTESEKQLIDSLKFCPAMRKAKVEFNDGAILDKVYLDCTDAIWMGDTQSGKLNDRQIKSISFEVKELKKCPHCSQQYRQVDWKYCPYCGKPLE